MLLEHRSFVVLTGSAQYLVQVIISHKNYNHISPTGPGIVGEVPIWVVTGPTAGESGPRTANARRRFVGRSIVLLPRDARRMTLAKGSLVGGGNPAAGL